MCLEFDSVRKAPHVRWDDQDVARIQSCASVHNGLVYVTDQAGYLNCYDALSGDVVYRYDFDTSVRERSQILADGKIYIPDDRGFVHVIKEGRDPVLLDKHRIKGHAATIEPTHGAIVIVTPREVMLFSDHVPE